ncbi:flagellar biosynthetic protein FliO [Vibrio sp. ZSDZ34]|uniref:Flagellar protein n=2 Tax=Vibrio gelatinilyticus TaxID=2893468 RepID=A0A9X1WDU2_9VIBR|nr:flagellar biosynthetic protein FliO [Vibrio gelatinilyticus]MCJ2377333.1 flagellar biosynthetic protein FliO [Vibrio gelatinilyticus]
MLKQVMRSGLGVVASCLSGFVMAQSEDVVSSTESPIVGSGATQLDLAATTGSLVLVIAIILGLAWLLKRMRVPNLVQQQGLKIVRQLPVGTKERIAIVEAGNEQFLVGITPQSIQLISKLDQPLQETEAAKPAFANHLAQLLSKNANK